MALPLPSILDKDEGPSVYNSFKDAINTSLSQRKQELENQYYAPNIQSEINNRNALTSKYNTMTPLEAQELSIKNQYGSQREQADIRNKNAMSDYYKNGGRGGVASQNEMKFHQTVKDYNQGLNENQLREANDVYAQGGTMLSDGTPIAPMNPTIRRSLDNAVRPTTTAALITSGVQANQAASELPIYDQVIKEGVDPYGTTVFGVSHLQIKDSADVNNPAAQKRLGNYLAAQALLYDRSALLLKANGLPPGVTLADEVKKLAAQTINAKFPLQSAESRRIASAKISKTIMDGLKARNQYGVGASGATGNGASSNNQSVASFQTPQGSIVDVPLNNADAFAADPAHQGYARLSG